MSNSLPPLVDKVSLAEYLDETLPSPDRQTTLSATRIGTGHSNETFLIRRVGVNRVQEWVLRRPPRGPLLPTAHDVRREYTLINALHGTAVPVPRPILFCKDESVIGAPFYLMQYIKGHVIRSEVPPEFESASHRAALAEELIQTLVKLHGVNWQAVGLDKLGKPEGYLARQLKRWTGQLDQSRTRQIPELDAVSGWLAEHLPESPPATIVHGDFRIDNVMYAPQPPARVVAVLDWEMATIGDPLADLGYLLSNWREPGDPPDAIASELANVTEQGGFPTRAEVAARYEKLSGRSVQHLNFYEALAVWKLAILLEGSYVRHKAGTTDDPFFARLEEGVPALARRAWRICQSTR